MASSAAPLPPVVFVHGLEGSHLKRQGGGGRVYLNLLRLVGGRLPGFRGIDAMPLPCRYDGDLQATDGLVSDGPIEDVRLFGIRVGSLYGPILDWLRQSGRRVYTFHYDWRRSQLEAGHALEAFLEKVFVETGSASQLIVHSNGGVVTFPVVNRRPELFHSVLWAASGCLGSVNFLKELSIPVHNSIA